MIIGLQELIWSTGLTEAPQLKRGEDRMDGGGPHGTS